MRVILNVHRRESLDAALRAACWLIAQPPAQKDAIMVIRGAKLFVRRTRAGTVSCFEEAPDYLANPDRRKET